jgi:hypothetical protein
MAARRGLLARPRRLVLGVVVMCATVFAGAASAQAAHYSLGLTFEFHNGFPHTTEVKVVPVKTVCAKVHPSDPKQVGKAPRVDLGKVDIETGGDCFWSFSFATLKLENARTGSVLAALEAFQTGPRLFDVSCKPKSDANPGVKSCVGGNDPLAPRWYWRIYHQPS